MMSVGLRTRTRDRQNNRLAPESLPKRNPNRGLLVCDLAVALLSASYAGSCALYKSLRAKTRSQYLSLVLSLPTPGGPWHRP
jgi:hypothetical protein